MLETIAAMCGYVLGGETRQDRPPCKMAKQKQEALLKTLLRFARKFARMKVSRVSSKSKL